MAGKGINEGGVGFVLCKVGFVVTKKDLTKGESKFITHSKLGHWEGSWESRRVAEGNAEAVVSIEDGALCPAEGEVARTDVAEGGFGEGASVVESGMRLKTAAVYEARKRHLSVSEVRTFLYQRRER